MSLGLSPNQRTAFDHAASDDIVYLGSGAVRGGKTAACGAAFGLFAALHDGDHVLIGRTEGAVMRNVVRPQPLGLLAAVRAIGFPAKISGVDGRHVSIDSGRSRIWIFGASDVKAVDRIAGSTFIAGMVDEMTRLQAGEELWQMLWTRFSTSVRKVWATTNPGARRHWVKRLIIDQPKAYQARVVPFTMDDNPSLPADLRESFSAGLFGHHKLRLVDGLWVDATGLVYPEVTLGSMPDNVSHWSIGLDWAASGVFASVLLAHGWDDDTGLERVHVAAERFYDHSMHGAVLDAEQARRTHNWFRGSARSGASGVAVFGDPTTPSAFQHALAGYGYVWQDGFNEILPGIQAVSSGFGSGHLTVDPRCVNLLRECDEYAWDAKAAEQGEDKPEPGANHGLDGLRYAWATPSPIVSVGLWSP